MPSPEVMQAVLALINADSFIEIKYVLENKSELLLTDTADQLLTDWLEQTKGNDEYTRVLEERRVLLTRLRQEEIEVLVGHLQKERIHQALQTFINAETWTESKRLVEKQRDLLLTDEADQVFADKLSQSKDDPKTSRILQEHRELLARCREEGIDAAFAEHLSPAPSLSNLWHELQTLTRPSQLPRRIEICQVMLAQIDRTIQPQLWAALQVELANSLAQSPLGNRADNFEQAISHYQQALEIYTRQAFSTEWAQIMNNLAIAYSERIRGARADNLEEAISHYRQALTVYTRQAVPNEWARTMHNLAIAYRNRIRGTRADNLEEAISHYRQALTVYTRQAFPAQWAQTMNNLATAYLYRIRGARADNLEEAIRNYTQALTVYTRQAFPQRWAMTINNLANAYSERIRGARADNLEEAIRNYTQTLTVYTRQAFPQEWASTMHNLAIAYSERIRGARANNIEEAIAHYKLALEVYSQKAAPHQWATTLNNLAIAYSERIRGARADNLELAIEYCKLALQVNTRQANPFDWALTQINLAKTYFHRIKGERADNLELAIFHYRQALQVYTRQAFPERWAQVQNNLATAYSQRIRGERADNLELAIFHYRQALQVYTQQAFPERWAQVQNDLAAAYSDRIRGERAQNLEQAIFHAKQALQVYTRQAFPERWAQVQNNLATAYSQRIRGERAENIERAITHFQQALTLYTRQAFPQQWAQTMNNLANAYYSRLRGERAENIEQAISCFRQALQVRTQEVFPVQWAQTMNNLAAAYNSRIRGERTLNLEQAISCYQQALTVTTRAAFPVEWSQTINNLANVYFGRIEGERVDNLEQAISLYLQALKVLTRETAPNEWARTQNNLANAYSWRIRSSRANNLEQAIDHYQKALTIRTPQALPQESRDTAIQLGHLLYDEGRFTEARQAFVTAHQALETLRGEMKREGAKRHLSEDNANLYARLVHCSLLEPDESAAFEYAVAGKGHAFVDMLASARFDISAAGAKSPQFAVDWQQVRELRQKIDHLLTRLTSFRDNGQGHNDKQRKHEFELLRDLQQQKNALWEDLAYKYPRLTATQSAPSLSAEQAQKLAAEQGATLVEFVQHAGGWSAFVITKEDVRHVSLDEVNDEFIQKKIIEYILSIDQKYISDNETYWTLDDWYDVFIAPLELPSTGQIILAPTGALHLIPLSIARHPDTERYFCDEYTVSFTPSLAALRVVFEKVKRYSNQKPKARSALQNLLSVAYPGMPGEPWYLHSAIPEAEAIATHFPRVTPLYAEAATPQALIEHAPEKEVVHFSCHGNFDLEFPEQSGLALSGGYLTVQRIITELQLNQCRLVTLSASLTNRVTPNASEEQIGLVQAMMTAGAQAVVASLWRVAEEPTRVLFEQFYVAIAAGQSPAEALRQAMQFVRQQPGWEHPYYWAAFQVSGLATDREV